MRSSTHDIDQAFPIGGGPNILLWDNLCLDNPYICMALAFHFMYKCDITELTLMGSLTDVDYYHDHFNVNIL